MNWSKLEELVDCIGSQYGIPGYECKVTLAHEEVFYQAGGYADKARRRPASKNDLYNVYSLTKLFTSTAILQQIERGQLRFADPISKFLPAWTNIKVRKNKTLVPCETEPTIQHLLTMTCGLNYNLNAPSIRELGQMNPSFTLQEAITALAQEPLDFQPGEHFQYSLCHDVLGAIIEVVSGMNLEDYFRENIGSVLGAKDMSFFPSVQQKARISAQYRFKEKSGRFVDVGLDNPYVISPTYASAGAGICAGINDCSLLADALANGGVAATGKRILTEKSVILMASDYLTPAQKIDFACMKPAPYSYGLGVRVLTKTNELIPRGEFGWDGAAGSYILIDPNLCMSLVYTQHVLDCGVCYSELHNRIRDTLYQIMHENKLMNGYSYLMR